MILPRIKTSLFYNELSAENAKIYFDMKKDKFYHNIDSLYYMITCYNDWNSDTCALAFKSDLELYKDIDIKSDYDEVVLFPDTDYIVHGLSLPMFPYFLESSDRYSFFIAKHSMTNTPQIWVQIRSQYLWLYGEHQACNESLKEIEDLLSLYGITIKEVKENRIDYAYHTNYIQDPLNFFREDKLNSMQVSNFKRYSLEGRFIGEDNIERDYITLGRKKSNNTFFRIYNKTKEVVEMGYKQFFIELWHANNMISYYDKYCIQKAFEVNNYDYIDIARLEFYLQYGSIQTIKDNIKKYINGYPEKYNFEDIRKYADTIMPRTTIICNIEIETKRKFYSTLDEDCCNLLQLKSICPEYAKKLYVKLDNIESFHNLITTSVIRFVDRNSSTRKSRCKTASWWKRLQQVKVNKKYPQENIALLRRYQSEVDIEKLKDRALKSIASLSVNLKAEESLDRNIRQDIADVMSMVTENEVQSISRYKCKKFTQQSNKIQRTELYAPQQEYVILNTTTGELL